MRRFTPLAASAMLVLGAPLMGPSALAKPSVTNPAAARDSLAEARGAAARALDRAAALDRQARAATMASERATIAAAALAARVLLAEASVARADAELALLRSQRSALDRRLARERTPAVRLVAALQTQVRRPALVTLLQPGSLSDAVHLRAAVAAVTPQIAARTASLRTFLERSRRLERDAIRLAAERRTLQAGLAERRTQLAALSAAQRLAARRAAGSADREAERAFAIAQEARTLSALVRRLGAAGANRRSAASARDAPRETAAGAGSAPASFRLPVDSRTRATRDAAGRLALVPRPGALVVSPAAGRVAFAGPYRGFGHIVIVEHPAGWTSLVTGLAGTQVAVGQILLAGSPLGQAREDSPEIGYELRRNGQRINPLGPGH